VEIANKVGAAEIIGRVVDDLKDEAEQYRKMVMETIEKVMANLGAADIDSRLEEQLIDGILYAFQEQTTEVRVVNILVLTGVSFINNPSSTFWDLVLSLSHTHTHSIMLKDKHLMEFLEDLNLFVLTNQIHK